MKNAYNSTYGGISDAFLAKYNATGSLVFSTYLGGSKNDQSGDIAVDGLGNSYVTGYTYSNNFPMKNAYDNTFGGGNYDAFVAKFDSNGSLVFSTYYGGNSEENGQKIAIDQSGNLFITGYTTSNNLPMINAYNATYGGSNDVFVAKFNTTGSLVFSTYLGGNSNEYGQDIIVDTVGNYYVTGYTYSFNFPIHNGYYVSPSKLYINGFITQFVTPTPSSSFTSSITTGLSSTTQASSTALTSSSMSSSVSPLDFNNPVILITLPVLFLSLLSNLVVLIRRK